MQSQKNFTFTLRFICKGSLYVWFLASRRITRIVNLSFYLISLYLRCDCFLLKRRSKHWLGWYQGHPYSGERGSCGEQHRPGSHQESWDLQALGSLPQIQPDTHRVRGKKQEESATLLYLSFIHQLSSPLDDVADHANLWASALQHSSRSRGSQTGQPAESLGWVHASVWPLPLRPLQAQWHPFSQWHLLQMCL